MTSCVNLAERRVRRAMARLEADRERARQEREGTEAGGERAPPPSPSPEKNFSERVDNGLPRRVTVLHSMGEQDGHQRGRLNGELRLEGGRLTPEEYQTLAQVLRAHCLAVLAACRGNKARAAGILGISRKSLYDKLKRWERA